MIQARNFRWIITVLPFLPLVLFTIPKAFIVMPEPGELIPWYTRYTQILWLLTSVYVYPTTWLANVTGFRIFGPAHIVLMLTYALAISLLLRRALQVTLRQPRQAL
jgi:hypothetical protein